MLVKSVSWLAIKASQSFGLTESAFGSVRRLSTTKCQRMNSCLEHSPNWKMNKLVLQKFLNLEQPNDKCIVSYIWIDGTGQNLRMKDKVVDSVPKKPEDLPTWSYDGSSTYQADGHNSDTYMIPRALYKDPFRPGPHYLALCDTYKSDKTPTASNFRAKAVEALAKAEKFKCWFGVEQEYTMLDMDGYPFGWPKSGFPGPQGPYYCGVGANRVYGRDIVEAHYRACHYAGIPLAGTNAEVMPAQWEFQGQPTEGIKAADDLWMARYLLHRVAEEFGVVITLDPKPMTGQWNGAGAHTNFSTEPMRKDGGLKHIEDAIEKLSKRHREHIAAYDPTGGKDNERRLTGKLETSSIHDFSSGVANRGCSIRIPRGVADAGKGWLEDRRPASNMDPYAVCNILVRTICLDEK
ncbi:gamma-glutamylcysteine synthetase [Polyplax serrata]|uniref:Glutamine synthetase n=1 Tax=Polyplax serrata TaxID=468196 RepID=A0AAN8SGY9_POLSC